MRIQMFNCASKLTARSVTAALALVLCVLPSIGQAGTICEVGPIINLHMASGGKSKVLVFTDGGEASPRESVEGFVSTMMEYDGNDQRWRDRLALLRMAYALGHPIKIEANAGSDCIGYTDEFTIRVCQPGKC